MAAPADNFDDTLLSVRDLSLDFSSPEGSVHALRDIGFDVPRGRIVGVVGESGCGKSTLASTMIRLLPENAEIVGGRITFDSEDILAMSEAQIRDLRGRRMSMIFQDPMTALNPVRSIGTQMLEIQHHAEASRADKRKKAVSMLAKVGIPDPENRLGAFPHQFSGGMRQRICIAMALLVEPALLLADEPTTALDATLEVQIVELLKALQEDVNCAILFVSHHLGTVAELCDDVVVMYAGEVIEHGPVMDIFRNPRHPYTQALLECDPGRIREQTRNLPTIPGDIPDLRRPPGGCIFTDRCRHAFDRCKTETPALHTVTAGGDREAQKAKCHLRDPAAAATGPTRESS
jgi:oligopeptide/dipeptide ABC transporter ATP-binding protein